MKLSKENFDLFLQSQVDRVNFHFSEDQKRVLMDRILKNFHKSRDNEKQVVLELVDLVLQNFQKDDGHAGD